MYHNLINLKKNNKLCNFTEKTFHMYVFGLFCFFSTLITTTYNMALRLEFSRGNNHCICMEKTFHVVFCFFYYHVLVIISCFWSSSKSPKRRVETGLAEGHTNAVIVLQNILESKIGSKMKFPSFESPKAVY